MRQTGGVQARLPDSGELRDGALAGDDQRRSFEAKIHDFLPKRRRRVPALGIAAGRAEYGKHVDTVHLVRSGAQTAIPPVLVS